MQEENKKPESQKSEEEVSPKEGVEFLKEIGLREVSNKTFINLENLTALIEKDFAKLNKTKALGFIQILQREFDVNLQELKNESLHYYHSQNHSKERYKQMAPVSREEEEKPKKFLSYLLLALAAGLGAYFLFFNTPKSEEPDVVDLNVVKNDTVTQEAQESLLALDEQYESETNDSDEVDLNKVVEEMFHNDINETALENNETNSTESNITFAPAEEENITLEDNGSVSVIEKITQVEVTPQKVEKPIVQKSQKEVKNSHKEGLYIEPIQKAWVGVIFLDSMKKKDFLIRKTLKLDASKDQIILVGHKNFKIFNKRLEQGFKSKKMVRFLYKDGELREISKKEYIKLRGGVRW